MKKYFALLLTFLLLPMTGCAQKADMQFYYPCTEIQYGNTDGVISNEARTAPGHEEDLIYLMKLYLEGPLSQNLYSPFPKGTLLQSLTQEDSSIHIKLSGQLDTMSGLDYTIACACIASTCFDLTDAQAVTVSTDQPDGPEMTLNRDSVALYDTRGISDSNE